MTTAQKKSIEQFAQGKAPFRADALEAYRAELGRICPLSGAEQEVAKATPHMRFMSEIDSPAPDLLIRAAARLDLCGGDTKKLPPVKDQ
jgi:hypothetical protein